MLCLSFFFSGMEIAFLSANRLKIELKTLQGDPAAQLLSKFKKKTAEVLITILIGNNLALVVFTIMLNSILEPQLARIGLTPEDAFFLYTVSTTLVGTLIVLVLAEYIPKAIFRANSDYLVYPSAYLLQVFYLLLRIPVWLINLISKALLRIVFRLPTEERVVPIDKRDFDHYLQEVLASSEDAPVPDLDTEMLSNALALRETKARECMIPRTEIEAISMHAPLDELVNLFIETRLSKIIIYDDSLDEVRGFVHSSSLFRDPERIRDLLQPVLVVPESMPGNVLMAELTENKRSVAIVVDEFGGTAGMLTIEDLVEEVFGEIEDEHDSDKVEEVEEDMIKIINEDGSLILGARHEIDDLNEELGLNLPEEEYYTTLGGLIMYVAEDIPQKDASIEVDDYLITVVDANPTRVIAVKVSRKPGNLLDSL
jgi:CBS domain containing-hemolysin-like protein